MPGSHHHYSLILFFATLPYYVGKLSITFLCVQFYITQDESGLKTVEKMKGEKTLAESISLYVKKWMIWVNSYGKFYGSVNSC